MLDIDMMTLDKILNWLAKLSKKGFKDFNEITSVSELKRYHGMVLYDSQNENRVINQIIVDKDEMWIMAYVEDERPDYTFRVEPHCHLGKPEGFTLVVEVVSVKDENETYYIYDGR